MLGHGLVDVVVGYSGKIFTLPQVHGPDVGPLDMYRTVRQFNLVQNREILSLNSQDGHLEMNPHRTWVCDSEHRSCSETLYFHGTQ